MTIWRALLSFGILWSENVLDMRSTGYYYQRVVVSSLDYIPLLWVLHGGTYPSAAPHIYIAAPFHILGKVLPFFCLIDSLFSRNYISSQQIRITESASFMYFFLKVISFPWGIMGFGSPPPHISKFWIFLSGVLGHDIYAYKMQSHVPEAKFNHQKSWPSERRAFLQL